VAGQVRTVARVSAGERRPAVRTVILHSASVRSQSQRAYLLIRDQIVTLRLAPGSVIEEARLQAELSLGRTPIREALQRLAHDNLVIAAPHRGIFVTDINITDLGKITEVRVVMEGYAARLAAQRSSPADREATKTLMSKLDLIDADDYRSLIDLDQRIHRQIYQAAHNQFLQDTLERDFTLSLRVWFLALERGVRLRTAVEEHHDLLDAIVSQDQDRAESVMKNHVVGFEQAVRKVL
jgi:DNA-binding GntR family transcriptional regulator